jgi:hypothetical protein
LGITGTFALLCATEYFIPNSTSNIPYLGDVINIINNQINFIIDWFTGRDGSSDGLNISNPESISRSNSGSSTSSQITLKDLRNRNNSPLFTPPNSRPETPLPSGSNIKLDGLPIMDPNWN